jgi:hypothetical protein
MKAESSASASAPPEMPRSGKFGPRPSQGGMRSGDWVGTSSAAEPCRWTCGPTQNASPRMPSRPKPPIRMSQLSRMLKEMSIRHCLNLPDIFKGLRLKGKIERPRVTCERISSRTVCRERSVGGTE